MNPRVLALVGLILTLFAVNRSVYYEQLLSSGRPSLTLGGFDPRSIIAGDYMRLNPTFDAPAGDDLDRGVLIMTLDEQDVGTFVRFDDGTALADREVRVRYRVEGSDVRVVPTSWFIEEGTDDQYEGLTFAEVHVADDGTALLVALLDEDFQRLGPPAIRW